MATNNNNPTKIRPAVQLLTNSRCEALRTCERLAYYRFEEGLVPAIEDEALSVGSAIHKMFEMHAAGHDVWPVLQDANIDPYAYQGAAHMWNAYQWRWADDNMEMIACEVPFELPLVNPETGAPTPLFNRAGKIDGIVRLADGRLAVLERKTTTTDISLDEDYWVRLRMDSQISGYFLAARELGYDVQTILYDVLKRPTIRPGKATPEEVRKYTKDGKLYASQRAEDEEPEAYGARCAQQYAEDPTKFFQRVEIPRSEAQLEEYRYELWWEQQRIRERQRTGRWIKNTRSCVWPRPCRYLALCSQGYDPSSVPSGFKKLGPGELHPELSVSSTARVGQATH
jgi:hypothetical protein